MLGIPRPVKIVKSGIGVMGIKLEKSMMVIDTEPWLSCAVCLWKTGELPYLGFKKCQVKIGLTEGTCHSIRFCQHHQFPTSKRPQNWANSCSISVQTHSGLSCSHPSPVSWCWLYVDRRNIRKSLSKIFHHIWLMSNIFIIYQSSNKFDMFFQIFPNIIYQSSINHLINLTCLSSINHLINGPFPNLISRCFFPKTIYFFPVRSRFIVQFLVRLACHSFFHTRWCPPSCKLGYNPNN